MIMVQNEKCNFGYIDYIYLAPSIIFLEPGRIE